MKKGQWLYFAKKGKRGKMVGNVLGRGYYLGIADGRHVFYESARIFTPKVEDVVVYSLGGTQKISEEEATNLFRRLFSV